MFKSEALRVLLIDMECGWVASMESQLQSAGMWTFLARETAAVLTEAHQGNFDVVVAACPLTEIASTDLPTVIRTVNRATALPIVWVGERDDAWETAAALELGIDLVLTKDVRPAVLMSYLLVMGRSKRRAEQMVRSMEELRGALNDHVSKLDQLRNDNRQLQEMSTRDPLTGVYNPRYMHHWLGQSFAYAERHGDPLSVMIIDIDHFKSVNDTLGHLAGDELIRCLALILRNSVRDSDLVARYGGDEFIVALPKTSAEELPVLAERILAELRQVKMPGSGERRKLSCSMGSATFPGDEPVSTYRDLVMLADQALYGAKRNGRGQLCQWHRLEASQRQAIESSPSFGVCAEDVSALRMVS